MKEKKFDNKQTASMAQVVADSQLIKEILFKQSKTRGEKSITEVRRKGLHKIPILKRTPYISLTYFACNI